MPELGTRRERARPYHWAARRWLARQWWNFAVAVERRLRGR